MSLTDVLESEKIGKAAVELATSGYTGKMLSFTRRGGDYGVDVTHVDASLVANKIKHVPRNFINSQGNFITKEGVDYITPLTCGGINLEYKMGIPHFFRIEGELCTR